MDLGGSGGQAIGTMPDLDLCDGRLCRFVRGFHCRGRKCSILTSLRNSMATIRL